MSNEHRAHVLLKQFTPADKIDEYWTLRLTLPGAPVIGLLIVDLTGETFQIEEDQLSYVCESDLYEVNLSRHAVRLTDEQRAARKEANWECANDGDGDAPAFEDIGEEDYSKEESS